MEKSLLSKEEFDQIKEQYPDVAQELLELSDAIQAKNRVYWYGTTSNETHFVQDGIKIHSDVNRCD